MTSALVWADSGAGVGLGHLARCGALAGELRARGWDVTLMTPGAAVAVPAAAQGGVPIVAGQDVPALLEAIGRRRPVVIADTYRLGREDYAAARQGASLLAVFSDDPAAVPPCDIVVNGVPGAETLGYDRDGATCYLLGAAYFPLRGEFREAPPKAIAPAVRTVLVTAGGEDVHGLLGVFAQAACEAYPDAEVIAVTGGGAVPAVPARAGVRTAPADYPQLVRDADVMVCGAGQALVEAAAVGTPAVAVLLGGDQRHQRAAVLRAGAGVDGGAWTLDRGRHVAVLRGALERLGDEGRRAGISRSGRALVDGRGAARIADAIVMRAGGV
jgi:spore coat polysaccharide biosynthesis predicted glycosyltransferase SpsG